MKALLCFPLLSSLFLISQLSAQEQATQKIEFSDGNPAVTWDTVEGRSYFLQHSIDLTTWNYLPHLELGEGEPMSYNLQPNTQKAFIRLQYTDLPTTTPKEADFDDDGINNWNEIKAGGSQTSPFTFSTAGDDISDYHKDSDGNLLKDGWELKYKGLVGLIDASGDEDEDGLLNSQESLLDSNPDNKDTDGDGLSDKVEDDNGTNLFVNEFLANPHTVGLTATLKNGLRAVWGFDAHQPNEFLDTSGNNFHASKLGNVARSGTTSGPAGHTATFSNNSDYLKAPLNVTTDTGSGAVSFWFKGSPSNTERIIFSRDYGRFPMLFVSYIAVDALVIQGGVQTVQKVGFFRCHTGVPFTNAPAAVFRVDAINPSLLRIDDDKWHHVVISSTGNSNQISIDGVTTSIPQSSILPLFDEPNIPGVPSNPTGASGFYVGALSDRYVALGAPSSLNATIDQFLVYDRALSTSEATALYNYDADGDGLTNLFELQIGTNPLFFDTLLVNHGITNPE